MDWEREADEIADDRVEHRDRLIEQARRARDLELALADLEEAMSQRRAELRHLLREEMVDTMNAAGITQITISANGNLPSYIVKLNPYYKAVIQAEWTPERRNAAYNWLEAAGAGDLIKSEVTVTFNCEEIDDAHQLATILEAMGLNPSLKRSVAWNTLTAWLKDEDRKSRGDLRQHLRQRAPGMDVDPLEVLGADVGYVVKLTPVKGD